jgi:hypothetical protein
MCWSCVSCGLAWRFKAGPSVWPYGSQGAITKALATWGVMQHLAMSAQSSAVSLTSLCCACVCCMCLLKSWLTSSGILPLFHDLCMTCVTPLLAPLCSADFTVVRLHNSCCRCLAEKLADPDFGPKCRYEVIAKLQRRCAEHTTTNGRVVVQLLGRIDCGSC